MTKNILNTAFLYIAIFSLVVIEIFCGKLAYETLGEITSAVYFLIIAVNIIPVILIILNKQKNISIGIILFLGFMIIPCQFYLGSKLLSLKEEAANLTAYLYEQKISNNDFPKNITGYEFTSPGLKKYFNYTQKADDQFALSYYVGTPTTSHFYNSDTKKWGYYPD